MTFSRPSVLTLTAALLALALSACSGGGGDPKGHNEADVEFATQMMQHHAQALVMVDQTLGRDLDPATVELTEEIRATQAPEIETMADWLEEWGEPVPETARDHANAHGDEHGMMSAEDMAALEDAPDERFQTMWLQMMVEHHEGAVEMARTQVEDGQNAEAVALAEDIAKAQEREIATMRDLLTG